MKVAFIGDRLGLATGGNLYIARVAEELAALGVEVTLITLVPPRDIPWAENLRLVTRDVDFSFGQRPGRGGVKSFIQSRISAVTELKRLIQEPYDILYSVGGPSNIVNHFCRKGPFPPKVSVAVIHHLFRQDPWLKVLLSPDTFRKPFQTFYHLWGDHLAKGFQVVTVSQFWRNKLVNRGFAADFITIIPNGADWQDWPVYHREEAKRELNLSGSFVVYTSPLRLTKGIMIVLQALRLLVDRFPDLLLLTSGVTDTRSQKEVQTYVEVNGLGRHFRYAGLVPRSEIPKYYSAADTVILASLEEEGWGVTLLEGMMGGRPVVCSPKGAMPELVGKQGIILQENTPPCLAQALERLMTDTALRKQLEEAGPSRARQFTFQAAALAHLDLFEKLLNRS
ncbi:MAG: glycosyltransferase family 4 protein [Thermodesulfobacteriota bacterium]